MYYVCMNILVVLNYTVTNIATLDCNFFLTKYLYSIYKVLYIVHTIKYIDTCLDHMAQRCYANIVILLE